MNRIMDAFRSGKAFIPFITAGDPDMETTGRLLLTLADAGADAIEIGIPFSDPIAEGPVIQEADERALKAGFTVDKLFDLITCVRPRIKAPLLFMSYYNPVFVYGNEKFTGKCAAGGIDGLIVPDLPYEERDELLNPCASNRLMLISLIAPTSDARIEKIVKGSEGFIYCVSSLGVTGERHELDDNARKMVKQAKRVKDIPCAVGFGISTPEQARKTAEFADGVITGSAIVRIVGEKGADCITPVYQFAMNIKHAIKTL